MIFVMIQVLFLLICASIGVFLNRAISFYYVSNFYSKGVDYNIVFTNIRFLVAGFSLIAFYFIHKKTKRMYEFLKKQNHFKLFMGILGLLIGASIAFFMSILYEKLVSDVILVTIVTVYSYVTLMVLSSKIGYNSIDRGYSGKYLSFRSNNLMSQFKNVGTKPKIIDTSVIIDGRIKDLLKTGFISGDIVIPDFILRELRYISDSSDPTKRAKGRVGLDILEAIRGDEKNNIIITEIEYSDEKEVDLMLLRLAEDIDGDVVTNDYNLNKVAKIKGVRVLNINDLSNAIKPMSIPGDTMIVNVVKEGKEDSQGVAYLEDGTMIVVEEGKEYIGKTVESYVTSVLQTSAGRMIFVKPKTKIEE